MNLDGYLPVLLFVLIGAMLGMISSILVFQLGQARIWFAMSRDGLLPKAFAKVHKVHQTPHISTWIAGLVVGVPAGIWDIDTGNGYYGGWQFDLPTWRAVGGTGLPSHATPDEQTRRAATRVESPHDLVDVATVRRRVGRRHGGLHQSANPCVVGSIHVGVDTEPGSDQPELHEDLPLVGCTVVDRQHGLAVVGDVAHGEAQRRQLAAHGRGHGVGGQSRADHGMACHRREQSR